MLTQTDLEKVAKLAKLGLTLEESSRLTNEIEKIISYFQQIKHLDLHDVTPMTHAVSIILPLRYDEIRPTKCLVEYLSYKKFNYISVPAVLE
jgi:aspartyl-tRNA(Asn)/glutamyl-tRNA(Gln) amidotransferase subunit C